MWTCIPCLALVPAVPCPAAPHGGWSGCTAASHPPRLVSAASWEPADSACGGGGDRVKKGSTNFHSVCVSRESSPLKIRRGAKKKNANDQASPSAGDNQVPSIQTHSQSFIQIHCHQLKKLARSLSRWPLQQRWPPAPASATGARKPCAAPTIFPPFRTPPITHTRARARARTHAHTHANRYTYTHTRTTLHAYTLQSCRHTLLRPTAAAFSTDPVGPRHRSAAYSPGRGSSGRRLRR